MATCHCLLEEAELSSFWGLQQQEERQWSQNVPERFKPVEKRLHPKHSGALEQDVQRGCTDCWAGLYAGEKEAPFLPKVIH